MNQPAQKPEAIRPYRLACLVVCATFPLMFVGSLVTTRQAGMAVPDWPGTFGYNLFLYPLSTWFYGPWDVFVEHGHRLLGALVGLLTIALVIWLWMRDSRKWMLYLGIVALFAVIFQGILGGLRVTADEVLLARIHACFAPLFFCMTIAIAFFTSTRWKKAEQPISHPQGKRLMRFALITTLLVYLQLVVGAHLRHLPADMHFRTFQMALYIHLVLAMILTCHLVILSIKIWRHHRDQSSLTRPATLLTLLIFLQLGLGCATWVLKYGFPWWTNEYAFAAGYVVQSGSMLQSIVISSHVAMGILILGVTFLLSIRSARLYRTSAQGSPAHETGMIEHQSTKNNLLAVEVAV